MRYRDHTFNRRRVFGSIAVYGIFICVYRVDVAACQAELFRIFACVYGDGDTLLSFQRFAVLGFAAVYSLFRVAPACERATTENQNQPLGGVRNQGGLVRRHDVSCLAVRVCNDHHNSVRGSIYYPDTAHRRHGVFRIVRLLNVPLAGGGEYARRAYE